MSTEPLRQAVESGALRALSDQDRDPASPTYGCFDRRYWAWKTVDFPEATFQRLVYPLLMLAGDPRSRLHQRADVRDAVRAGLQFAMSIQHANGSFDQAFPWEQSWGATAFLLQPLVAAFELVRADLGTDTDRVAAKLSASAAFLRREGERHGTISNHLAGGAHSLLAAGRVFDDRASTSAGEALLAQILASQSDEGWFPEYGGADPGYQTLCLYYLAEIARLAPSVALTASLDRALGFLQWFVHPDGTLGGVYGSRRTRLAYLGGFALLAKDSPVAASIAGALSDAVAAARTVTPQTVDAGNLAPVLTTMVRALSMEVPAATASLPRDRTDARADFPKAGLHVRATPAYYAIVGSGNGGTLTVFDRATGARMKDDGGYTGLLADGRVITSQVTAPHAVTAAASSITVDAEFREVQQQAPRPWQFLILRLLNLTVMRSISVGNIVKRALVKRLVAPQSRVGLAVTREFTFGDRVGIRDRFSNANGLQIRSMRGGLPFSSVHMASAGYYEGAELSSPPAHAIEIDAAALTRDKTLEWSEQL